MKSVVCMTVALCLPHLAKTGRPQAGADSAARLTPEVEATRGLSVLPRGMFHATSDTDGTDRTLLSQRAKSSVSMVQQESIMHRGGKKDDDKSAYTGLHTTNFRASKDDVKRLQDLAEDHAEAKKNRKDLDGWMGGGPVGDDETRIHGDAEKYNHMVDDEDFAAHLMATMPANTGDFAEDYKVLHARFESLKGSGELTTEEKKKLKEITGSESLPAKLPDCRNDILLQRLCTEEKKQQEETKRQTAVGVLQLLIMDREEKKENKDKVVPTKATNLYDPLRAAVGDLNGLIYSPDFKVDDFKKAGADSWDKNKKYHEDLKNYIGDLFKMSAGAHKVIQTEYDTHTQLQRTLQTQAEDVGKQNLGATQTGKDA